MTTRPGFIWSGTEWVAIGQEAIVNPFYYQATAPTTPSTGDIWIESDVDVPSVDPATLVTLTDTQTLTNKTLTSPTITGSGFDAWTSYTPTFTGLGGAGTYTTSAKYQRIGKTVTGRVKVTVASGTPINGSVTFTLPFTAADSTHIEAPLGLCGILDYGSQYYPGYTYGVSTTTAIVYVGNSSSTYHLVNGLLASVPMTWTTNDFFSAQFTYEAV
jgi:hypothetical protein